MGLEAHSLPASWPAGAGNRPDTHGLTGLTTRLPAWRRARRPAGPSPRARSCDQGVALGGEERDVAVLFVDVVGSARLATQRPPAEVVAVLNGFFTVVVDVVGRHGGWINQFQGDAALGRLRRAGATRRRTGLRPGAARELGRRLRAEVPAL